MLDGEVHSTIRVALERFDRAGCSHRSARQVGRPRERILTSPLIEKAIGKGSGRRCRKSTDVAVHHVGTGVDIDLLRLLRVEITEPDVPGPEQFA